MARARTSKAKAKVELAMKRLSEQSTESFRHYVWELFKRIVENTPQYSGAAAANWRISVGTPGNEYDPSLGAFDTKGQAWRSVSPALVKQKGDREAVLKAIRRNSPRLRMIKGKSRVYITNSTPYVGELQSNWRSVLRDVNRPYEIAQESAAIMANEFRVGKRLRRSNFNFRMET